MAALREADDLAALCGERASACARCGGVTDQTPRRIVGTCFEVHHARKASGTRGGPPTAFAADAVRAWLPKRYVGTRSFLSMMRIESCRRGARKPDEKRGQLKADATRSHVGPLTALVQSPPCTPVGLRLVNLHEGPAQQARKSSSAAAPRNCQNPMPKAKKARVVVSTILRFRRSLRRPESIDCWEHAGGGLDAQKVRPRRAMARKRRSPGHTHLPPASRANALLATS